MFLEISCFGPAFTNGILLACDKTKECAIIDAPSGCASYFLKRIKDEGLVPRMILLTHSHWDHTADVAKLKDKLQVPIYVHERDAENVRHPGSDLLPHILEVAPAEPDQLLIGGETLHLGELKLAVIHTPGHSGGGVCFYLEDQNVLIAGDTLFQGAIGRLDLPTSEPDKMWPSLEKLAKLPPQTRVIPGHGEETTIGSEEWLSDAKKYFGG